MARRIAIRPVEPLEIAFSDGTIKKAWFTNASLINIATEYEDVTKLLESAKTNPYDAVSKILHCALQIEHPETSLEEAKYILIAGGNEILTEIYEALTQSFGVSEEEIKKKLLLMKMQQ